jgi:hypothetical protein
LLFFSGVSVSISKTQKDKGVLRAMLLSWGNGLSRVVLFVKSVKTVTETIVVERIYTPRPRLPPTPETRQRHEYVLPEDQKKAVEIVKIIASKYGLEVEVVDVARENVLHRILQGKRDKLEAFPTLVADTGQRLEGEMTEEKVEQFMHQIASEGRKKYL